MAAVRARDRDTLLSGQHTLPSSMGSVSCSFPPSSSSPSPTSARSQTAFSLIPISSRYPGLHPFPRVPVPVLSSESILKGQIWNGPLSQASFAEEAQKGNETYPKSHTASAVEGVGTQHACVG